MIAKKLLDKLRALPLTERIALIAMFAFVFFAWDSRTKAAISFLILAPTCLISRQFWQDIRQSHLIWVVGLLLLYILLRTLSSLFENPDYIYFQLKDAWRLALLAGFICMAWVLRGHQTRIFAALAIALLGFWTGRLQKFPWHVLSGDTQWWQERMQLGLPSEIAFGQYSAAACIGLIILAPRIFAMGRQLAAKLFIAVVWALFLALSMQGIFLSQSRGTWLSLIILAVLFLFAGAVFYKQLKPGNYRSVFAAAIIGMLFIGFFNYETLLQRVTTEMDTATELVSGNLQDIAPYDAQGNVKSIGIRYHMMLFGIEHWKKNPLFGLGPGITQPLVKDEWPWQGVKIYSDLHNAFIEILLRLGIIGFVLIALILLLLLRIGWRAHQEGRMSTDLLILLYAEIALHLLGALTNFRMLNYDWRYYWFLFAGILLSFDRSFLTAGKKPVL
ncbi:MAG: O-antigen ligase family protein [gamma proteobacterium symbiont of Bathyaustriella thionipta]|nr:O-antigen ligase family protein [gamma proteobacterium symbiont of Bathyaustriella thionipta]